MIIALTPTSLFGQNEKYLGLEILGNGGFYSINYLQEFSSDHDQSCWGVRSGFGIIPVSNEFFGNKTKETQLYFPVSANYRFSRKFEVGLGITLNTNITVSEVNNLTERSTDTDIWIVPSIGYRKPIGDNWLFKVSMTPIIFPQSVDQSFLPWFGAMFAKRL